MAKLFVSYSRKDSAAARKLIDAFRSIEQDVWVDWESIPPAVDWLEQIFRGIEEADAFLFLISPDSIISEVCKVELARAVQNNKRIIPIVLRDVHPKDAPESIRKLNWTFVRETDNFDEGLAKVKTAIELDLDWLEEHRRLQVRALEWHRKKDVSLLLHGRDLRNAMRMVQTYTSKDPIPTELQQKYIEHSRRTERNRIFAWIATGIAIVALSILAYTTFRQSVRANANALEASRQALIAEENAEEARENERAARDAQQQAEVARDEAEEQRRFAEEQKQLAEAQRSAARARIYQTRTGKLYTSTLLALDSWQRSPNEEAEQILRENINLLPLPVAQAYQNGSIHTLELSPDGTRFLSASSDGVACVRNLEDGTEVFCASGFQPINDAIFVQGGTSIAVGDEAGLVQVLNIENESVVREVTGTSPVRDLDVAPNGRDLSIARANGNITVLNVEDSKKPGYNLQLSGRLTAADMSPDGRWYTAGSETGVVSIWNLNSNKIFSGSRHRGAVFTVRFSPNSRFVVSGGEDNYAVGFDTASGNEIFRLLHADWVRDISFGPDGSWFVTGADDGRVRVWGLSTAQEELIMFQDSAITNVEVSADGKWITSTGEDNTVRVWSAYTGVEMYEVPLESAGLVLGFTKDSQHLISGDSNGNIGIWDISGMIAPTNYLRFNDLTWISKFNGAGDTLIAASANRLWLLDTQDLSTRSRPADSLARQFRSDIYDVVTSPEPQMIGFSTYENEYILYDVRRQLPIRVDPADDAYAISFSGDGARFITATQDGVIETWDPKTGKLLSSLEQGTPILSIAASPTGVALGAADKIILLDPNAEQQVTEWQARGKNEFLAYNADGSLLASANSSGQVEIWKWADGAYQSHKTVNGQQPHALAFDPQSNLLAVGTVDQVYLVDAETGEEISRVPHRGAVYSVAFSPDGKTLATASLKVIQLWDVSTLRTPYYEDIVQAACSRLIENFSESEWSVMFGSKQPYVQLCKSLPIPE